MLNIVPRGPRLVLSMLSPSVLRNQLPPPFDARATYYLFRGRNAIYHGIRALGLSNDDSILVPSFNCASVVEPIFRCGANVEFFNIRRDASPDFDDLQAKIGRNVRAVLAIHYFGFPQQIHEFQQLCKDNGLYLIEDCAHVLAGESNGATLGTFGDISIFSWRKFLPLFDGGQLVNNNSDLRIDIPWEGKKPLGFYREALKKILVDWIEGPRGKLVRELSTVLPFPYRVGQRFLSTPRDQNGDIDFSSVNLKMSGASQYIIQNANIPAIIERRRSNYIFLLRALESMPGITPLFPDLPQGVCPWVLPALIGGGQDFHLILRSAGIPIFTWRNVIHRKLPLEKFPDASFLYKNLVFLPIHQSLGDVEMATMIEGIDKVTSAKK